MTRALGRPRPGHALAELLAALTLLALVAALVLDAFVRESRAQLALASRGDARAQLQAAGLALAADLRALSPRAGDVAAGEARDSSVELRALVGAATVCDTSGGSLAVREVGAPDHPAALPTWTPSPGDSAWFLAGADDSVPTWSGTMVTSARHATLACGGAPGVALAVDGPPPAGTAPGTPVRLTRRARWSLYHSSDSRWYLGYREWNATLARFDGIQPVAGPLAPHAATGAGLELRYFDRAGAALPPGLLDTRGIARVELTLRAPRLLGRPPRPGELGLSTPDSERITIALGGSEPSAP